MGCQITSKHIYKAYERGQPWFGCYWAPTAVLGKYKMVKVDLESGIDQEHFTSCLTQEICEDPKPSMYPPSPVKTIVVESFVQRVSEEAAYLTKWGYPNGLINELLAWVEDNQAEGESAAVHFLTTQESLRTQWVMADAAKKLKVLLRVCNRQVCDQQGIRHGKTILVLEFPEMDRLSYSPLIGQIIH